MLTPSLSLGSSENRSFEASTKSGGVFAEKISQTSQKFAVSLKCESRTCLPPLSCWAVRFTFPCPSFSAFGAKLWGCSHTPSLRANLKETFFCVENTCFSSRQISSNSSVPLSCHELSFMAFCQPLKSPQM